jgi:phytoene synthase
MPANELAESYECCRRLHRASGRTFYLGTLLLPRWKRRHVHALYGFTRYTDDIVDGAAADREVQLRRWIERFMAALNGASIEDPILPAVRHTIAVFDLDPADFAVFLESMAMDLTVTGYDTYDDLLRYMEGSAAAIGTMMLPILGTRDRAAAREPARHLGFAFQLTNFIRDVAEDLARGRIYLPAKDLADFGVTPEDLRAGVMTPAVRRLIACEIERAWWHYRMAAPGIAMLEASSQPCIRAAFRMYRGILDQVIANGYDVFSRRAVVPDRRRLTMVAASLVTPVR